MYLPRRWPFGHHFGRLVPGHGVQPVHPWASKQHRHGGAVLHSSDCEDPLVAVGSCAIAIRRAAKHGKHRAVTARRFAKLTKEVSVKQIQFFIGNGIFLGSFLATWHVLPVFLDLKIAADEALPGLTAEVLPITTTAIFMGWLAGSLVLKPCLEVFSKEQLVVGCACGLVAVTLLTVTLPHLTAGNLAIFTCIRFLYGILMNITGVQIMYIQEGFPGRENQASVAANIGYCLVLILMGWMCGGPTLNWDWRLEALLWNALPICLGLAIGFPNLLEILEDAYSSWKSARHSTLEADSAVGSLSQQETISGLCCAMTFLACGCSFYGLSYSAGKLSSDVYLSTIFLSVADIFAYVVALSADWGRAKVQAASFALAACCLFLCSTGEPGTPLVLTSAMIGRLCLDVCFTTIYVGLGQCFSQSAQKTVLSGCEITARLGGILAPYSGTLPASASCKIFGAMCLVAAWATGLQGNQIGAVEQNSTSELEAEYASR
eukprot:Skav234230  [mRNA]  locus=scaffold1464:302418:303887:+ [translate_table: standard]